MLLCRTNHFTRQLTAQACSPKWPVPSDGRGGGAPALASAALVPLGAFAAQRRGHVGRLVALVGQELVEG